MQPVRTLDGFGVERRSLFGGCGRRGRRRWLCHAGILGLEIRHVQGVQPPGSRKLHPVQGAEERGRLPLVGAGGLPALGGRLTFLFGLLLTMSALTGWYSRDGVGATVSVIGWNTGTIGKIVFFLGLATVLLVVLREVGVDLPATVPESLVAIGLGSVATILVLVRIVSIPDTFFDAGRGVGIWISLACAVGIIVAGLLEASEEL